MIGDCAKRRAWETSRNALEKVVSILRIMSAIPIAFQFAELAMVTTIQRRRKNDRLLRKPVRVLSIGNPVGTEMGTREDVRSCTQWP